jgi:hypothetical protein
MRIDFGDVFADGIGWLLKQLFLFAASVWLGCSMGAAALIAGGLSVGYRADFELLFFSPVLLLTLWLIPNLCFFAAAIYWFVRNETNTLLACGILAAVQALVAVAGWVGDFTGAWLPIAVAWVACVVLIVMLGTGLWFLHQWRINRWAGEIAALKAENAMRRAEMEREFGTKSVGADELGFD